ncbi:MAG: hypothetical protein R2822_27055 [Spirosomataceae bacterium]
MKITLLNGHFEKQAAISLLEALIAVKVNYHENQIHAEAYHSEEDIKMSENRIKALTEELKKAIAYCQASEQPLIDLTSSIIIA